MNGQFLLRQIPNQFDTLLETKQILLCIYGDNKVLFSAH